MAGYFYSFNLFQKRKLQSTTQQVGDLNVCQSEESKLSEIFQSMNMGENAQINSVEVSASVPPRDVAVRIKYPDHLHFAINDITEIFVNYVPLCLRGDGVGLNEEDDRVAILDIEDDEERK